MPTLAAESYIDILKTINLTGVVLTGGNDIGVFPERDKAEQLLLKYAVDNQIPVLGICRGMQVLATNAGAKLVEADGHTNVRHKLYGVISHNVNSYHRYVINKCPDDFKVLARNSSDDKIEAIAHESLRWEGWMWHPEREKEFSEDDLRRVRELFG